MGYTLPIYGHVIEKMRFKLFRCLRCGSRLFFGLFLRSFPSLSGFRTPLGCRPWSSDRAKLIFSACAAAQAIGSNENHGPWGQTGPLATFSRLLDFPTSIPGVSWISRSTSRPVSKTKIEKNMPNIYLDQASGKCHKRENYSANLPTIYLVDGFNLRTFESHLRWSPSNVDEQNSETTNCHQQVKPIPPINDDLHSPIILGCGCRFTQLDPVLYRAERFELCRKQQPRIGQCHICSKPRKNGKLKSQSNSGKILLYFFGIIIL